MSKLAVLRRETEKLQQSLNPVNKIIFEMINSKGVKTATVDLEGQPATKGHVITVPEKALKPLLTGKRHTVLYGGRAGSKSHTIARFLISLAYSRTVKILCVREIQTSIRESVHSLLSEIIEADPVFRDSFEILESEIRGNNGSLFSFRGMRKESAHSIKGYESFDIAWIEEANAISRRSIDLLIPTIRKKGSRFIWSFNPENNDDPVYQDFILIDREDTEKEEILYTDNPFVSAETLADVAILKKTDLS
jgi:phage terminase large subunit